METKNIKNKRGLNFFKTKYFYIALTVGIIALVFILIGDKDYPIRNLLLISLAIGNITLFLSSIVEDNNTLFKIVHSFLSIIYLLSFFYLLYRIKSKKIKIGLIVLYILLFLLTFVYFFLWTH